MDLRDYLRVLRKGWPLLLAFVVLGLAAGIGLTLATTKVYQADVQIFVRTAPSEGGAGNAAQDNTFVQAQVQSYTSVANVPAVTTPVARLVNREHGLNLTSDDVAEKITADAPLNKVLVNLHVTDTNPRTAAILANAVADRFNTVVENLESDNQGNSLVVLRVNQPAVIPAAPIKPNRLLNIGLGFVVGVLIGVGLVVLRDVLDNTVKGPGDFEEFGVPAVGIVPFDKRTPASPIAFRNDPSGGRSEAYRQIRTNLQFVDVDNPPKIISVTSALPGEGKSTTALNLAASLAEAGSRVCLVEADLRRPSLAKALGLIGDVGFTTALIGKSPVEDLLQNAGQNLAVLTSGPIPPNPSELLITHHARQIIEQVAANVDFVVIDTPPLLPVTDGAAVATLADATLLVTRTGKTTHEQAARAVDALAKVGKRPVGVVLNMVTRSRGGYSYEYGYYYEAADTANKLSREQVGVSSGQSSPDGADNASALMRQGGHDVDAAPPADHGDGSLPVTPNTETERVSAGAGFDPGHNQVAGPALDEPPLNGSGPHETERDQPELEQPELDRPELDRPGDGLFIGGLVADEPAADAAVDDDADADVPPDQSDPLKPSTAPANHRRRNRFGSR